MFRKILAGVVLTVGLLGIAGSAYAQDVAAGWAAGVFSTGTPGLFCYVESQGVCVIAQTEEDCTELGGEKADSCEAPDNTKGKE